MDNLTNIQKKLLISMYKEVISRRPALSFREANYFDNSDVVRDLFLPDESPDYVAELCWKLEEKGYINCEPGDDMANDITIDDKTIIYMENRFKNGLSDIISFLTNLL